MKKFVVTLADGAEHWVEADSFGPKRDYGSDKGVDFTVFVVNANPVEVLTVNSDAIVTIEEVQE
jgi:hypothetical protein